MDKSTFALAVNLMLGGILVVSWVENRDGDVLTTGILAMIGTISGAILGFKFGKGE